MLLKCLFPVVMILAAASAQRVDDFSVLVGKADPARRVDVVRNGGYFPVLVRLDNGDLGAALRGGDTHIGVKGRLDWVRSTDGGITWSSQLLADSEMDDRNPAVGQLRDGTVLVVYTVDRSYGSAGERLPDLVRDSLYTVRSHDHGHTWEKPVKSEIAQEHGASPYGRIVELPDGTALLNVYYERGPRHQHETSLVYRSRDGGKTWGDPSRIAEDYNETALLPLPDGVLLAVPRSHGGLLATSVSRDQGRTWSTPRILTKIGEHPADVIRLQDGRLLLMHGVRNRPFGVRARLSRNSGQDWDDTQIHLITDAHNRDCGYPSSVEIAPGRIVTLYYGVDETRGPDGKTTLTLQGAYARAVLWTVPR